ncbi:MAG: acyl carrier protein [Oscillospiraceae bacterium]|nr:acyl carrier protein [Oscillospiraceae bacterium]
MNNLKWDEFAQNISDYVGVEKNEINEDTDLYSDLCLDSLGLFSIGMYLNGIYKLEVPLSTMAVVSKVGDMYRILNEEGKPSNG